MGFGILGAGGGELSKSYLLPPRHEGGKTKKPKRTLQRFICVVLRRGAKSQCYLIPTALLKHTEKVPPFPHLPIRNFGGSFARA